MGFKINQSCLAQSAFHGDFRSKFRWVASFFLVDSDDDTLTVECIPRRIYKILLNHIEMLLCKYIIFRRKGFELAVYKN